MSKSEAKPGANADAKSEAKSESRRESKIATYRLLIEYEGTRYSGWQEQKNAPTVMGALLRALSEAGFPVHELGGAGRTDAGVHALQQNAHLRLEQRIDPAEICRALNKRLPRDVHVLSAAPAALSFHARHDAVARSYLYQISSRRTALAKPWVWWVRDAIDVAALREAAQRLTGRHDFRNFAEIEPGATESTLVEVESVEVVEEGALVLVRIVASHFLWKMVRRLIGTLVQVGARHLALADLERLLEGAPLAADDPRPAQWTAPPSGLFLERVLYPGDPALEPIAAVTPVPATSALGEGDSRSGDSRPRRPPRPRQERRAEGRPDRGERGERAERGDRRPPRARPEGASDGRPPRPGGKPRRPGFTPPPFAFKRRRPKAEAEETPPRSGPGARPAAAGARPARPGARPGPPGQRRGAPSSRPPRGPRRPKGSPRGRRTGR